MDSDFRSTDSEHRSLSSEIRSGERSTGFSDSSAKDSRLRSVDFDFRSDEGCSRSVFSNPKLMDSDLEAADSGDRETDLSTGDNNSGVIVASDKRSATAAVIQTSKYFKIIYIDYNLTAQLNGMSNQTDYH